MFARRIATCSPKRFATKSLSRSPYRRHLSTSGSGGFHAQPTNVSVLGGISSELDRLAPRIDIRADQIKVLEGPTEFYDTLKNKIRGARKRIYLSTLYIGRSEHELISCIREALQRSKDLRVSILTDALRGTRETPEPSCASLLSPLVAEFPQQVEIRMYHTPNLTGLRKRFIPKRINEGWGLQHMKLYGIDDDIILSGANLSNDYFTNRQDRYHVFSSKRVTDYFARIHHAMCSVSFILNPGEPSTTYTLEWPTANSSPSPLEDPRGYTAATTKLFTPLITPTILPAPSTPTNTTIYPLLTLPRALNNELPALQTLLSAPLPPGSSYLFTAGYFNPHPSVTTALLACSSTTPQSPLPTASAIPGTVLTASPWANGFYGSSGVSGMLPAAYTLLSRRFLQAANKAAAPSSSFAARPTQQSDLEKQGGQSGGIQLREWRRGTVGTPDGWTYHAKGLWITLPTTATPPPPPSSSSPHPTSPLPSSPCITLLGSSNYTKRSYTLDTEVGAVIVTTDAGLKAQLKKEEEGLLKYSQVVREEDLKGGERRVGVGVRVAMWIVGIVGGAL
ncbi:CDP-diacylglycerol--glycerol-3-phosphate 3-phosphatidyltransferase [Lignoscripta atroalba]|nr:CDP-diacylglycerol--glycerol-3-phosphate 3-phosphatidyltransferase [Lignoscripta atroalba]